MSSRRRFANRAPAWAKGTFIWRLVLADHPDALVEAEAAIAEVAARLDHAVEHIVFLTGAIGADEGHLPWDGIWPYWQRLSHRAGGGDWRRMSEFMLAMRKRHRAWISFHVNCTDVNPGLALYPETRDFFARLRKAGAIYTRPKGDNNQPWAGLPVVPLEIPVGRNPSDIFALVHYQRFWDSGLAREQIDGLLDRLPYVPPLLYLDVLGAKGWCHHPGFPDGDLGGSLATQNAGIRAIVEHLRTRGCAVAGESPDRLVEFPIRYSWSHGGLAADDYSAIGSGWGMGAGAARGGKGMQVYGNQGGYHLQCGPSVPALVRQNGFDDQLRSRQVDGLREWGNAGDLVRQFHLTVAPELHHIGLGARRLPREVPGSTACDAAQGRARIDAVTIRGPQGWSTTIEAESGTLLGTAHVVDDTWASGGQTVAGLDLALGNGVALEVDIPVAGAYEVFVRAASVGGGVVTCAVGGGAAKRLEIPDTGSWHFYGDLPIRLAFAAGRNRLTLVRERIFAAWDVGTRAEWTLADGFRAWRGDLVLGEDGDRFWPDTWSGQRRILIYSETGGMRSWTLPGNWSRVRRARLWPLTTAGRDGSRVEDITVRHGRCRFRLGAGENAVLVPVEPERGRRTRIRA